MRSEAPSPGTTIGGPAAAATARRRPSSAPAGKRRGYGESVYGTRGGPIAPRPWGVTTQRGDRVYVHVLDWRDAELALPALPRRVRAPALLVGGARVPFTESAAGVVLTLPTRAAGEVDQVVVLDLAPARR